MTSDPAFPHLHLYAGLTVASQRLLPELPVAAPSADAQLRIGFADAPLALEDAVPGHRWIDDSGVISLRHFRLDRWDVLVFPELGSIASDGHTIRVHPEPGVDADVLRRLLLDQALPRFLGERAVTVLHASLVLTPGGGLLCMGQSGQGKSTMCAALGAAGAKMMADDAVVLKVAKGTVTATATYPGLRLWADSFAALSIGEDYLRTVTTRDSGKARLTPDSGNAAEADVAVIALILLGDATSDASVRLTTLGKSAACMAILGNSFRLALNTGSAAAAALSRCAEIGQLVPVTQLDYPRDFSALPAVIALLDRELSLGLC